MERWKIEYNIRCYEIATLMMKYEFDINRVDRILSKVYKESVENSVNSGIIEERGWITKNGRRIYIGEDGGGSGKSKIENAFRNGVNIKSSKEIVNTIIEHHESLGEFTPKGMKKFLENCGYDVKPLGSKSSLQGQRFEDGGGYRIAFGGDGYFQYHPKKASHHKNAYWKIGNGEKGMHRYEMDGKIKND